MTQFLGQDDDEDEQEDDIVAEKDVINDHHSGDDEQSLTTTQVSPPTQKSKSVSTKVSAMFTAKSTPGINSSLMMNYTRHWISFSSLKLLKSCLVNYLPTTKNSRHEQFTVYLSYLTQARQSYQHYQHLSELPAVPWLAELLKENNANKKKGRKNTGQIESATLSQVFSSRPRDKTQFLAFLPFLVKNCHYDEERKQICMHEHIAHRTDEQSPSRANVNSFDPPSPVGVFLDTLCKLVRNFFKNDVCTNLHVTELLSTLLQTPDRRLFGLLFDETLARPIGIPCLLHILQILSVEGQRYADNIPNFDALFANVKCALFPNDQLGGAFGASNNNNGLNGVSNQAVNGDGK